MQIAFISSLLLFSFLTLSSGLVCWECQWARSQEDCLQRGRAVECQYNQDQCHLAIRLGGWGPSQWIEKSCKTTEACLGNNVQNVRAPLAHEGEQVQCTGNAPSIVCKCCCGTALCNQNRTSCLLSGMKRACDRLEVPHGGSMNCLNDFDLGSNCNFACNRNFVLDGEPLLTCSADGEWDYPTPRCRRITCRPTLKSPEFGTMRCTNRPFILRSTCRFTCEEGYRLSTRPVVKCIDDEDGDRHGLWTSPQPRCIPKQCTSQTPLRHGMITCTNANYVDSVCTFTCESDKGYFLVPKAASERIEITCLRDETWDMPRPSCSLGCPQFATMDLVIILDSSSSVGAQNWMKMLTFMSTFVRQFTVRDNATRFAVIRYGDRVDRINQITFNDYPDSNEDVAKAIMALPYDGSGRNTGEALNYVHDVLLPLGNREFATNVVLLLTDGKSSHRVALPARRLRTKALIYVIPIQGGEGGIDLNEINSIAGRNNPDKVFIDALFGGFDALDAGLVDGITDRLCDTLI